MGAIETGLKIPIGATEVVSALLARPDGARALLLFAHGAGAGIRHAFMQSMSERLAARRIATLRYHFPYMEQGKRRPDSPKKLLATVHAAIDLAIAQHSDLPLFAGGKSMGGRMTSTALAEQCNSAVRGIAFFGFPLHPAGVPGTSRAGHLHNVAQPMLFLQGTRDKLADLALLEPIVRELPRATMHVIDGADHGFHVLKRSGRTDDDVLDDLANHAIQWITQRIDRS